MGTSKKNSTWLRQEALSLENETLRLVVVPEMGGKIVSLFDKRTDVEWLIGPDGKEFKPVPYGAVFTDQDMSGWDEMFPTIGECEYPVEGNYKGALLPDHGEVWPIPWTVELSSADSLWMSVEGRALPYIFRRGITFGDEGEILLNYEVTNTGNEAMPLLWASHPQFDMGESGEIILPETVTRVVNVIDGLWGWGSADDVMDYPEATVNGETRRLDKTGPYTTRLARKYFVLPDEPIEWSALLRNPSEDWVLMSWSAEELPYFGIWADEGGLGDVSVATPEPMTGYYDSTVIAYEKGEIIMVGPDEIYTWSLRVKFGRGRSTLKK